MYASGATGLDLCPGLFSGGLVPSQCHALRWTMVTLVESLAGGSLGSNKLPNIFVELLCSLLDLVGTLWGAVLSQRLVFSIAVLSLPNKGRQSSSPIPGP